jgi:hypothetical protein
VNGLIAKLELEVRHGNVRVNVIPRVRESNELDRSLRLRVRGD